MGLPILCVATVIFALFWGIQNYPHNPVPSVFVIIGVVGISYYLLISAHYHKTATGVVAGVIFLSCGRIIHKILFP
ncbi:hypothetical protein FT637_14470 [Bacillus cereus]|uniref:hypothetical protein n=1 Tax=Bacillus cereus TaxID=1396 RepID=UPI00187AC8C6|nr:hypothetical protein [Bacillus cereus]MBE7104208.1 hypothetical protein [Bacillus cereus]